MQGSRMSRSDEVAINHMMERMQMEDIVTHFNKLADTCFAECVSDFQSTQLRQSEEACVLRCVDKFSQFATRFQQVFVEHQTKANKAAPRR